MHFKQLDGLRGIAIIMVVAHHWIYPQFEYAFIFHYGAYGVDLFFVLSGFLITNILVHQKQKKDFSLWPSIKTFYIRRSLRIFPIYYLTITILTFSAFKSIIPHLPWLLAYQYNNHIFFHGWQLPVYIQHLWTLSIEEQYYLFWPLILFLLPTHKSFDFMVALIILSISFTAVLYKFNPNIPYNQFTLCSFSGLTLGSILAHPEFQKFKLKLPIYYFFILFFFFIYLQTPYLNFTGKSFLKVIIPFPALLSFFLVKGAIDGYKKFPGKFLENPNLVFIGKISYGIYIYHMFIPFLNTMYIPSSLGTVFKVILNCITLFIISLLSWFLIEKPINSLKARFNYN